MKNAEQPAFAFTDNRSSDYGDNECHYGLTKREYFAAMAMQGLVNREGWAERFNSESGNNALIEILATASVKMADELLKQLES